jgi:hypothetical protein
MIDTSPPGFVIVTFRYPGVADASTAILIKITLFWNCRLLSVTPVPLTETVVLAARPVPIRSNCWVGAPRVTVALAAEVEIEVPEAPAPIERKPNAVLGVGT